MRSKAHLLMRMGAAIAFSLGAAIVAPARTIYVHANGTGDYPAIQAAIDAAVDGDSVILQPGTYTGAGNHNIHLLGKAITVRSTDPNDPHIVTATIIDCENAYVGFSFDGSEGPDTVLDGFTITRGKSSRKGAAIYSSWDYSGRHYAKATIRRCNITYCNCDNKGAGGVIYGWDGLVEDCIFEDNNAIILLRGTLKNSIIRRNSFTPLYSSGNVINCLISDNSYAVTGHGINITNTTIANNGNAGFITSGPAVIKNSIIWGHDNDIEYFCGFDAPCGALLVEYSVFDSNLTNLPGLLVTQHCINTDPCFADPGYWDANGTPEDANDDLWVHGDYHLKSQAGRWDPISQSWVQDEVTSPCIDAGDPSSPIGFEPFPNAGIVNMGAYGGTAEASKSYFGGPVCETIVAGDINGDCKVDLADLAIMSVHWLEDKNPTIESDFHQALQMLREKPLWPNGIMYYDMQNEADSFIGKYKDSSAVEFLQTKIEDPNSRKLALLMLAKLAPVNPVAEIALYEVIYGNFRRDAVTAIAYLDPNDGRPIAETIISHIGPLEVRTAAVEMLIGLGDHNTLKLFEQIVIDEKQFPVKNALESAIIQLEYRLTQIPPDEQSEWARWEILCWRTLRETPLPCDVGGENRLAAETLYMQGFRFSRDYLEYKLNRRDLLAIAIIGFQKEAWAVQGLKDHASRGDAVGDFARSALAEIGTSEALRAIEASLIPGGNSRANTHLLMILETYGDRTTAEFMKNLSTDQRWSESERAAFYYAYEVITRRLEG